MYSTIIVGASGQGKTLFAKHKFVYPDKKCIVFDINNEYFTDRRCSDPKIKPIADPKLPFYDAKKPQDRCRFTSGNMEEFLTVVSKKRNTNVIVDEATSFFEGRVTSKGKSLEEKFDLRRLISTRKHSQNNYIINFISIEDTPPFLFRTADYIILFKTGDSESTFTSKSMFLKPYYLKLKTMPDYSKLIIPKR